MSGPSSVGQWALRRIAHRIAIALLCAAMAGALVSTLGCSRKVSDQPAGMEGGAPTGSPAASASVSPRSAAATDLSAEASALESPGATGGSVAAGRAPKAKGPRAAAPGTKRDDARPDRPARAGSTLTSVPAAPTKTLSGVKLPQGVKKASYAVTFEPYGWAPNDGLRRRLLINVIESRPDDAAKALSDLTGMNAIVLVERDAVAAVSRGGRYFATITVQPNSMGRTELVMSGIRRSGTDGGKSGEPK